MKPNFIILYVSDPLKLSEFYAGLLGIPVLEASPGFALLPFNSETMLGLWKREAVQPKVDAAPGAQEIAVSLHTREAVDSTFRDWQTRGIAFLQEPTDMDFGRTCVARDIDGHRIRLLCAA